jgi:hypothetical protein
MIPDFFPRDSFYCVLDEHPDVLVEPHQLDAWASMNGAGSLIVNPRCAFGWQGPLPPYIARAAGDRERLFAFPWMIWVDDADRGAVWPYALGPDWAAMLEHFVPGQEYRGGLPAQMERTLRIADILVSPDASAWRRHGWAGAVQAWAPVMERGYMPLEGVFPPFQAAALRRYYRYHTRIGTFQLGDDQSDRRYIAYDEPVTRFFHRQLTWMVGDMVRTVVVPTYNYLAFYQGGSVLEPHVDREECQYTLSVCIDATPDPVTNGAWPLNLMTVDGPVSVTQRISDGLLFRGRELSHWRDRLADGYTSSSLLFHFVDAPTSG